MDDKAYIQAPGNNIYGPLMESWYLLGDQHKTRPSPEYANGL